MHENRASGQGPGLGVACGPNTPTKHAQALGHITWPRGTHMDPLVPTLTPLVLYPGETPSLII